MSRFRFELAKQSDDSLLRTRMAQDWMEGDIAVSFRREPNYFSGCAVQGEQVQVIVCRETASNRIVGLGSRGSSLMYVNGEPMRAGYLADLRGDPAYRKGTLLARGYRFLRALDLADPLPIYYTIIYETNVVALRNLVGARAGLPSYVPLGRVLTPAIHLDFPKQVITAPGVVLRRARVDELSMIVAFLNRQLCRRQFAPAYQERDFLPGGRCSSLPIENFFLAIRDDRIVGTVAGWDQGAIRQTHVERYSSRLAALRPIYNFASRFFSLKPLPPVGGRIPHLYLCCIAIEHNEIDVFRTLLRFAYNQLRSGPWNYAIIGMHERDPLVSVLSGYRAIAAAGVLHRVDMGSEYQLSNSVPYIEIALA